VESRERAVTQEEWATTTESVLPPMHVGPGMLSGSVNK